MTLNRRPRYSDPPLMILQSRLIRLSITSMLFLLQVPSSLTWLLERAVNLARGRVLPQSSYPRARPKSSLPYIDDDDEPPPFVMKSDKHKRILGIDQKTSQIKRSNEKRENSAPMLSAVHRKRSFPRYRRSI